MRLGDRVATGITDQQRIEATTRGCNLVVIPEWDAVQARVVEESWRVVTLKVLNADQRWVDVELLRPLSWLEENNAAVDHGIDLHLPELGVDGPGVVMSIGPSPPIAAGAGRVVTGRFIHRRDGILRVRVAGVDGPIGVTDTHHVWSVDRQEFLPAGELQVGETLELESGPARILAIDRQAHAETVYNLEVHGEHVFRVTTSGLLVHNSNSGNACAPTGGKYGDLDTAGGTRDRHHMPADSATDLPPSQGPAIEMDRADHRRTASYGGGPGSAQQRYRDKQKELWDQGKYDEAFEMDIDDVQSKFGDKYDDAIYQAIDALP